MQRSKKFFLDIKNNYRDIHQSFLLELAYKTRSESIEEVTEAI